MLEIAITIQQWSSIEYLVVTTATEGRNLQATLSLKAGPTAREEDSFVVRVAKLAEQIAITSSINEAIE